MTIATTQKLRVLFVDDEQAIRDIMKIELPRMGHDVVMCEDGYAAIKALEKQPFDAAIVDLRMPGLSGWDVIDHIKKVSPETEVIISTGHGDMEAAIQAIRDRHGAQSGRSCRTSSSAWNGATSRRAARGC